MTMGQMPGDIEIIFGFSLLGSGIILFVFCRAK